MIYFIPTYYQYLTCKMHIVDCTQVNLMKYILNPICGGIKCNALYIHLSSLLSW